jgi:LDH2 family malate/lactate/ureidoglycolate dehydrogenase
MGGINNEAGRRVSYKLFAIERLGEFSTSALEACGLGPEASLIVTDTLLHADMRGHDSHGVARLPVYCERLRRGLVNSRPNFTVEMIAPSILVADADNGPGPFGSVRAVDAAIEVAQTQGVCIAVAHNSNHNGSSSYYVERATKAGCIAIAMTNAPPSMSVHGAREATIGTNAIAFGAPTGIDVPLLADMATSVAARGKIVEAARREVPIPDGWAQDEDGRETNDPNAALKGVILPFAGAKGSALAIMVEVLCGVLAGGRFGQELGNLYTDFEKPQAISHFFLVVDVSNERLRHVTGGVAQLIETIKAATPVEGSAEILMPGEVESRKYVLHAANGLSLHQVVIDELNSLADTLGIRRL